MVLPEPGDLARPWTDAYPPGVPVTFRYPAVPVTRFLDDAARDFPLADALVHGAARWTHGELVGVVDRAAAVLADLGLRAGERVAVVGGATPITVVALLAVWRCGGVAVPLDPDLTAARLATRLAAVAPCLVVTEVRALDGVLAARAGLPSLRHVVVGDPGAWAGRGARLRAGLLRRAGRRRVVVPDDDVVEFESVLRGGPSLSRQVVRLPTDPAVVVWSSGTGDIEGSPVVLTHGNLVASAFQSRLWVPEVRAGREVVCCGLAPFDAAGLVGGLLSGLLAAATVVLVDRPTGESLLDAVTTHGVTLLSGPPVLFAAMTTAARGQRADLVSVRVALAVGAHLPVGVRLGFEEVTGGRLRAALTITRATGLTHASPVYGRTRDGAVGLPVTDTVAAVRDLDDPTRLAAPGEVGELLVAGPQVTTARLVDGVPVVGDGAGGWLATGDIAAVDVDGVFRLHGRVAEAIVRDGHRTLPADVETALLDHPRVGQAAAFHTPGPDGALLHAVVVPRGRARLDVQELRTHLGPLLDAVDQPDRLHVRPDLPTTPTGRILRRELRARHTVASSSDHDRPEGADQ